VVSGANGVTAADMRKGEGVPAVRVACTSIFQVPAARQLPMGVLVSTLMMMPHKWFQVPMAWQLQMCVKVMASQLRVLPPSTPDANSESIDNGRLDVDLAGNSRVSPGDVFLDAQDMAVNRCLVSPHPHEHQIRFFLKCCALVWC